MSVEDMAKFLGGQGMVPVTVGMENPKKGWALTYSQEKGYGYVVGVDEERGSACVFGQLKAIVVLNPQK